MRTKVLLQNIWSEDDKCTILRNLGKIMDVRVIEVDIKGREMCFLYRDMQSYEQVKQELIRLGYPIEKVLFSKQSNKRKGAGTYENWEPSLD